jgi:hypothetical protein
MLRTYWQVMAAVLAIGFEAPQVRALWYLGSGWHRTTMYVNWQKEKLQSEVENAALSV